MALLTFLLMIFSMSSLLHASHDLCEEDYYCPAGVDCASNSSLCLRGMCMPIQEEPCEEEVLLEFGQSTYDFAEDIGLAELELVLDGSLDCCSILVRVKVEDITATGDEDYEIPPDQYIEVTFSAGKTRAPFTVDIINDNELEDSETFRVSIFVLSVPYGINLGSTTSTTVTIQDDDSTTVSYCSPTFTVNENDGRACIELCLDVPATFPFTANVDCSNNNLTRTCDRFEEASYDVPFPNGTTSAKFCINITDDDIYEGDESFSCVINDPGVNLVILGSPSETEVVIKDDEQCITASFEKNIYRVDEHQGTIRPKLNLSEPSPCCFIIHAQLKNNTALGRTVDYGYETPKIYNYTFKAGSICAYPDADIEITDDKISENEESFEIFIIPFTLPFGVKSGGPATIIINDNDNACWIRYDLYTVREDQRVVWLELVLEHTAATDLVIPVNTVDISATGGNDYATGPFNITIKKGARNKYFSIPIKDDNLYEGKEEFRVIVDDTLPLGIVRARPFETTVEIEDDEYIVCFKEQAYDVDESKRVKLDLTLSIPLPFSLRVTLKYRDVDATSKSDYYASPTSVTFPARTTTTSVTVNTRNDRILEQDESFIVATEYALQPNNTDGCFTTTTVTIKDDDKIKIKFERDEYRDTKSSPAKPRLVLSETPTISFSVIVIEEDGTAIGNVDYKVQGHKYIISFAKGGSRYASLQINRTDDDLVEDDEFYYLEIVTQTLHPDVNAINPSAAKIILVNEDVSTVTRAENTLKFSKAVDLDVDVTISYRNQPDVREKLLPGNKEITFDDTNVLRISIYPDCRLERSDFSIKASSVYIYFTHC